MKIKNTSKCATKIIDISKKAEKVDPEEVAKALGAEVVGKFKTSGGPLGAMQAYEQYKQLQEDRYYLEFAQACARGMPDKDCTKYFKRYDVKELPRVTKIIGMLKGINPKCILDVGSGRGRLLWPMAFNLPDTEICCVDTCDWRVEVINAVNSGGVKRICAFCEDITESNFFSGTYDVVVASEVIEHIPDAQKAVSEMLRITKQYFIATVPSKPDENPDHIHYFTSDDFQKLLDNSGCDIGKIVFDYVQNSMVIFVRKNQVC